MKEKAISTNKSNKQDKKRKEMKENQTKKKTVNLMMDIETLGTKPGCVVLEVCVKNFMPDGSEDELGYELHEYIDVFSSLMAGLETDDSTLKWWKSMMREEAREAMKCHMVGRSQPIGDVMEKLCCDLASIKEDAELRI